MNYRNKIMTLLFSMICLIFFQSCSDKSFISQADATPIGDPNSSISYDCSIGNETIAENDFKVFFLSSSVPYGSTCQSQDRYCTKGFFSGTYQYSTCDVEVPESCLLSGVTVAHGQSATAYQTSTVPYGQTCAQQQRTCTDGILSGNYVYTSCSVAVPAACIFNGVNLAHGAAVTAFAASTVAYGLSCQSETRTCNNGTLSGTYAYAGCAVNAPAACLFNGSTIPHGATTTAYSQDNVPFWMDCADVAQTRTCTNGTLSGSFPYNSCSE